MIFAVVAHTVVVADVLSAAGGAYAVYIDCVN